MAKSKKVRVRKAKKGGITGLFLAVIFSFGAVMLMATTMVFVVGMVPTAVAIFSDTSKHRTSGLTVGPLNFVGVLPVILELWSRGHTVDIALQVISDPFMLLYMYGSAAIGAFIFVNMPPIISIFLKSQAKRRVKSIEKEQDALIQYWGPKVAGEVPETTTISE